jgi:predicted methyltransferase
MRTPKSLFLAAGALLPLCGVLHAQPASPTSFQQRVTAAMQSEIRTPEERARDVNRLPVEILSFFRMRENMRVIEILPAGGWFTKILAPVLADEGKLYVVHPEGFYANAYREMASLPGLETVEEIGWGAAPRSGGGPFGPSGRWDVEPVDIAVTFRNYHNFSPADRATVTKSVCDALKDGGLYGIVDHTRRHNEPQTRENGRRVDPVLVIKEVQDAGFDLVDFSNLYYRPNDALALEVANPAVNDRTDRIALLFREPTSGSTPSAH